MSLGPASSTGWGGASSATRMQLSTLTVVSARMARTTVLVGVHQLYKLDLVALSNGVAVPALPTSGRHHFRGQPPAHPLLRAQPPPLSPQRPSSCLLNVLIIMLPPVSLADYVPQRAWTVFGNTVGSLLSRVITTTATTLAKATGSLFCLPKGTLPDRKASSGRDRRFELDAHGFKQVSLSSLPRQLLHALARVHVTRTSPQLKLCTAIYIVGVSRR